MGKSNDLILKDLVQQFVNNSGKQQLYADRKVLEKWPEYVGELCASQSQCISLKNGIMKVKVPNAALRFELTGRKSMIMERINADYTITVVRDIMFL